MIANDESKTVERNGRGLFSGKIHSIYLQGLKWEQQYNRDSNSASTMIHHDSNMSA